MAKPVDQSRTQWNKKGERRADGSIIEKGYLSQKGKDTKRVTGRVNLVEGKRAGQTQKYVTGNKAKGGPSAAVGGYNPSARKRVDSPLTAAQIAARKAAAAKAALDAKNKKLGPMSGYQAGRGMTAQSPASRAKRVQAGVARVAAEKKKFQSTTSGTVTSARATGTKTPRTGSSGVPGFLEYLIPGVRAAKERWPESRKDPYPSTYKPRTAAQKASVTYLPNGNARVYDPKLKKTVVVVPTDYRHPKFVKPGKKGF